MSQYEDLLIDLLLDYGFTLDEASRLIRLCERMERVLRSESIRRQDVWWPEEQPRERWN